MMTRDHGGGIDAAVARWGGAREDWLDLSTGINPHPYPIEVSDPTLWTALPDQALFARLNAAARAFWNIPDAAEIVPASGASALIAALPGLWPAGRVDIPKPTYNEHAAAFDHWGWVQDAAADTRVLVNPNNPDGRHWTAAEFARHTVIDESFCDVTPDRSLVMHAADENTLILKSFGKFWGLAGIRLGFAICLPNMAQKLRDRIGPWAVSGPALHIGAAALENVAWAQQTRDRLQQDAARMDSLLTQAGLRIAGGSDLFRLAHSRDAKSVQERLAKAHILVRVFPYSKHFVRFGLPYKSDDWARLGRALT